MPKTIFDKIWDMHTIEALDEEMYMIAIDRIYLHDLCGTFAMQMLNDNGYKVRRPSSVIASPDHTLSSFSGRTGNESAECRSILPRLRKYCKMFGVKLFDLGDSKQGIIHIIGPEQGWTLPGMTLLCGDSHTCTHGAVGCLAMGVGTSEVYHALATSCLVVKRPKTMKIKLEGILGSGIGPMDIMLALIAKEGCNRGNGYAVEYSGPVIEALDMDDRFTLCNMTIELGAEYALISPDEKTIEYIKTRPAVPKGELLEPLISYCKDIKSDPGSVYDEEISFDVTGLKRYVSWGINPGMSLPVEGRIPDLPEDYRQEDSFYKKAYEYMDLRPGQAMKGLPIQRVFIGGCANGRLSHIRKVAEIAKDGHVPCGVEAWVIPGSEKIKREAEKLGLDIIIKKAGFMWGEPGCSLCVSSNGEKVAPGERCVSTTNRNFVGRQGRGARTHLASPTTAALSALAGCIQ